MLYYVEVVMAGRVVSVRLPVELLERVDGVAGRRGCSRTVVFEEALRSLLGEVPGGFSVESGTAAASGGVPPDVVAATGVAPARVFVRRYGCPERGCDFVAGSGKVRCRWHRVALVELEDGGRS